MIEKEFLHLGFNENEKEVYLAILHAGKISPHKIASLTKINRTTVYSIGKKLMQLGLISEDKGQKVSYFQAEKPEKLFSMIEKEEDEVKVRKESAHRLVRELSAIKSKKQYSVPRIKFIEEGDLSKYLYGEYDRWKESVEKYENTWWGFHDDSFTNEYTDFIHWSWKQSGKDLKVRFFSNSAPVEKKINTKHLERRVKQLPQGSEFDSSLWVVGDYVLMVQTRVRPHYLVEIYDEVLARNQRALFKGLWDKA